jgi:hypothetical protein
MDIDIKSINNRNVDIPYFLNFAEAELKKHISLVTNSDYKKIAFTISHKNNFKKFFEEIVPLMFFLKREKDIYSKIKYMAGSQKGDAVLDDSITVEITKAQHKYKYIVMQDILNKGFAFSPKKYDKKTSISSPTKTTPYCHENKEHVDDVALYISKAIEDKLVKKYPIDSILIISLESDILMLECDGDYCWLEEKILNFKKGNFSKIYIMENFLNNDLQPKWQFML